MNRYDAQHLRDIAALERRLYDIYATFAKEAVRIGHASGADISNGREFTFDAQSATKRKMDALLARFRDALNTCAVSAIDAARRLSKAKNDEVVERAFGKAFSGFTEEQREKVLSNAATAADTFAATRAPSLNLSRRVWELTDAYKRELELALEDGLRHGDPAAKISRDVRRYLKYPDKLFRRVRDRSTGMLRLSKAAAAFHPGRGVYRSSYRNAVRMTGTEVNIAYRTADFLRWQDESCVVGIKVSPSATNHPVADICDDLAGVYPKDFKFTGWHPSCRCFAVPILKTLEENQSDVDAILDGQEPSTKSVNAVERLPKGFTRWIAKNEKRMTAAVKGGNAPYFVTDNIAAIASELGKTVEEMLPSESDVQSGVSRYFASLGYKVAPKDIDPDGSVVSLTWPQALRVRKGQKTLEGDDAAIEEGYVVGPAYAINAALRGEPTSVSAHMVDTAVRLRRLVADNSLPFDLRVTRYVGMNEIKAMFGADVSVTDDYEKDLASLRKAAASKPLRPSGGFLSTSIDPKKNLLYNTEFRLVIDVPAHMPIFITDNSMETEAILAPDTHLRFIGAKMDKDPITGRPQIAVHCVVEPSDVPSKEAIVDTLEKANEAYKKRGEDELAKIEGKHTSNPKPYKGKLASEAEDVEFEDV